MWYAFWGRGCTHSYRNVWRPVPEVYLQLFLHLILWGSVSHWAWSSPCLQDWLDSILDHPAPPPPFPTSFLEHWDYCPTPSGWDSMCVLWIQTRVPILVQQACSSLSRVSPAPHCTGLWKNCLFASVLLSELETVHDMGSSKVPFLYLLLSDARTWQLFYSVANDVHCCIIQSEAWKVEIFPQAPPLKNTRIKSGTSDNLT